MRLSISLLPVLFFSLLAGGCAGTNSSRSASELPSTRAETRPVSTHFASPVRTTELSLNRYY
jgi:hypothetical protein